jgi:DNA-binding Xre family transcriptional regulator
MRDTIKDLNKQTLANATGISYSRLRKYATGLVKDLTQEEQQKIYNYLIKVADKFKIN